MFGQIINFLCFAFDFFYLAYMPHLSKAIFQKHRTMFYAPEEFFLGYFCC